MSSNFVRNNKKNKNGSCKVHHRHSKKVRRGNYRMHDVSMGQDYETETFQLQLNASDADRMKHLYPSIDMCDGEDIVASDSNLSADVVNLLPSEKEDDITQYNVEMEQKVDPSSAAVVRNGGLLSLGLDPLQLSLDNFSGNKVEALSQQIKPTSTSVSKLYTKSKTGHEELSESALLQYAPHCIGHSMTAKLRTVTKLGANKVTLYSAANHFPSFVSTANDCLL